MAWIVFLLGIGLAAVGGGAIWNGAPIIDVERGWSQVIAGSVALSGGIVTIALACILVRLNGFRTAWRRTGLADALLREAAGPVHSLAGDPPRREPAEIGHPLPRVEADDGAGPDRTADGARHGPGDLPPLTPEPAAADWPGTSDPEPPPVVPVPLSAASRPARGGFFRRRPPPSAVPAGPVAIHDPGPAAEAPDISVADDPGVVSAAPSIDGGHADAPGPGAPEESGMPAAAEDDAAIARDAPRPAAADETPALAGETAEPAAVVGRYSAGGVSYVMFADGSIAAETSTGTYRFPSIAELKAFIEERGASSDPI